MADEPSVEVSNDQKANRTNRTGSLWLSLVVLLLNGSWAIYYFQYNNLPMPLTAEQAGKRGFSEALSLVHVKNLTGFGPHPVGSDTLDLAIQTVPHGLVQPVLPGLALAYLRWNRLPPI
ncbi:hypothetical protein MA16_Dca015455 [Dendrobium catenatum]|uniref:Uncharacterized protein n=1 Tax=Dendrobium catenatum TaxID=906689 RepID=A0A2I0VBX6_9ASPA|nr:hypothetical protein MA16_Dca015455 [Dendrobium catenatum]